MRSSRGVAYAEPGAVTLLGHGVLDTLLLAWRASEASLSGEACRAYRNVATQQVVLTGRRGYEEACRLLARLAALEQPTCTCRS
jgi:hypothetical protein